MALLPQTADEVPLSDRALAGDREAWEELIRRHDRSVRVALLAHGVRIDRARELVQEAWTRLIENAGQGKLARVRLPGLAITQALWLSRTEARRAPVEPTDEQLEIPDRAASPEALLLTREQLERARRAVDALSRNAREVFMLLHTEPELTHAEIAARVGLSTQRVRQIACEIRKKLRQELEEERS